MRVTLLVYGAGQVVARLLRRMLPALERCQHPWCKLIGVTGVDTAGAMSKKPSDAMQFTFDFEKAKEAIVYLASKMRSGMTKYTACKLLFLADKYHLVRYGRTITGDKYFALPYGPVPTKLLDLLSGVVAGAEADEQVAALSALLTIDHAFRDPRISAPRHLPQGHLSKSDIEALDEIIKRYGRKTFAELRALTHELAAYQNAWTGRGTSQSAPMAFEDFFEEDPDALVGVLEEAIEDSRLRKAFPAR